MFRLLRSKEDYQKTILRNQLTSLILFESIKSVRPKSKDLVAYANHFFNKVKSQDLNAKKLAFKTLLDKKAIEKVFEEILPRYDAKDTTFVKRYNIAPRAGDGADMSITLFIKGLTTKTEKPATKESKKEVTK